jgi:DNA-binding Lrp family transcriptional regulator
VRHHLTAIPELLEMHTITGAGDMLCRIVARSNADLQRVIDLLVDFDGIIRTSTVIAMDNPVPFRVLPLTEAATSGHDDPIALQRGRTDT